MNNLINQTAKKEISNNLIFKTSKTVNEGKEFISITIRLNDECKNGHQDFSITGDIYEANKPRIDRYCFGAGCIHDEIIKHFPEFEIFVKLHLSDCTGVPLYAIENGFYHLKSGFSKTKPEDPTFIADFCDYYRITPEQYEVIKLSQNKLQYALNLQNLGILKQWNDEAQKAIKILEGLTGKEFLNDSIKSQFNAPKPEEIKEEEEKQKAGYYSEGAILERKNNKILQKIEEMKQDAQKDINKINVNLDIKIQLLKLGGEKFIDNCIYYDHTKELCFNWKTYGTKLSESEIEKIKSSIVLPEGSTFKIK